ncbi:OLC1v1004130C1 [Oldenlandia corymbosa var. corymbosa]|uniref:DNA-directed RNA polymerase subunit n=1 Tax=Oldenlandia corymbosa var. corymbosa TaxID=529605 RepID=A0AAV1DDG1_OLDCO|nr:OLC1v1004130C1 [Oldenlandia corymbosa var. corymbosa]
MKGGQPEPALQFTKQLYIEDVGPRKIESIQFSTFGESDILKAAEVEVFKGGYYESKEKPWANGLLDNHMGPQNKTGTCLTCGGGFQDCPGHYGYLVLALPVYNVGYLSTVLDILKCICKQCSRVLLGEELRINFLKRMRNPKMEPLRKSELQKMIVKKCTALASSRKAAKCAKCGYVNGMVKRNTKMPGIVHERLKVNASLKDECSLAVPNKSNFSIPDEMDPKLVHSLLKNMLDEDCELLYLNDRPEKLMVTSILVPPTAIRPSVFVDGGTQSNENDISERLKRIIQANASLVQEISDKDFPSKGLESWILLQVEVAQYINSEVRVSLPIEQPTKPLSGFVQRLKGKQGRFRGNLSGKRVEFTGRTVISPDPNLKITEVAIPILMARILTFPERVSRHNIEKLRKCVRNGPNKYPGAKLIKKPDGTEISLMFSRKNVEADDLKCGYIVHRHLEDGDVVLFNRQPSLHRMSIMCHQARIMPWRTLRFNESVCNPYNADFDGDEMNMHVPQTVEARTEALLLMGVQNNLCTPKNGEILVASTQDFLTSSFLITRKDTFYDRATFSLICSYMGDGMDQVDLPTPALVKPVELWTGKQLFSILLRPYDRMRVYLNLTVTEKSYIKPKETMCPNDGYVCFRNSELISGQLGKATLGNGNKDGLYSVLLRDYSPHGASVCMNRLAKLSARWIGNHGFSIGIDDVQPPAPLILAKDEKIRIGYKDCDDLIQQFNKGHLELQPGHDAALTLEAKITGVLNDIREHAAKECMKGLQWRNSPLIMSQCGSKGSPINISQMVACVGQQSVGGRRAPNGFIDRSLPHFPRKSKIPQAKGFVANSFYSGLTATEFFFHTMGGREGLVDTAVKTADTGYMSRRLMKALEDLSIHYDNTVRNASSCIVQFVYGDDGMDPAQMEEKTGQPLNFDRLLMNVKATCNAGDMKSLSPSEICKMTDERLSEHDMTPEGGCSVAFRDSLAKFLKDKCVTCLKNTIEDLKSDADQNGGNNQDHLQNISLNISGITAQQLEVFLRVCISRYHNKRIEAGTAIGAIGAQSIGEPGTQMTLKTFHFAGVASMNVTLGVPRIKEIINAANKISTPIISAKLKDEYSAKDASMAKARIEKTLLGQVAKSIKIVMSGRQASIVISLDMEIIRASRLSIDAYKVKESILRTPRIKLKEQHVRVRSPRKLEVVPQADKSKLHFELHAFKNKLPAVVVSGINTVERVVIKKDEKKEGLKEVSKYHLFAEGTGLLEVMGTEGVNGCETRSNHVMEVKRVLGIEAARTSIIDEIRHTMSSHGMTIDIRHMMLLADLMTFKGEVLGITRFGVQKMKDSVLTLASFEKTSDHLFNASVSGRVDKIEGVSECIIMGIPMLAGTGMIKIRQRVEEVKLNYGLDPILT